MSVKMKFGSKDIPFVYKGDKLVYPNPIKDGLLLWYDFKGMRNTDTNKEVAKDLSGNGNDGTLTNFNFTEESGYKDNTLIFDGVDDKLIIPELELDETAMSVMYDGKLYAYEDDKVVTVGEDGEVIGGGKNLLLSSDAPQSSSEYELANYTYTEKLVEGEPFTATIKVKLGEGIIYPRFFNAGGNSSGAFGVPTKTHEFADGSTIWKLSDNWKISNANDFLRIYQVKIGDVYPLSTVEWCKLERGTVGSPFVTAVEDFKTTTLSPTSLTDLQLYNKTLHKEELLHNAENKGLKKLKPGVVVQDGLVLHYDFSHESNTSEYKDKAFDYSGNGNHGTLNNFNFTEESGYKSKGLTFDGVDDFIGGETGSLLNLDSTNESIEITFEITNPEHSSSSLALLKSGGVIGSINVFSGWGRVTVTDNIGISHIYTPNRESLIGKNAHLVLTKNNGLFTAHINGELVEMKEYDTELDEPLVLESLSRGSGTLAYDSALISSRIYNRALTPEEIAHNYQIEKEKFDITEGEM